MSARSGDESPRLPMSSFYSIVMRARESTPTGSKRQAVQDSDQAPCSIGSAIGRTGAGSRPSAQRSHPAIRLIVGLSRHLPFDRRPRRSHPGGRDPAAVRGPASVPGSSSKAPKPDRCRATEGDGFRGRADVAGAPGLASLVLTHPGSTATGDIPQSTIPGQGQGNVARLTLGVRPPRIDLPAKGRGPRPCGPRHARAQPEQPSLQLGGQQVGQ